MKSRELVVRLEERVRLGFEAVEARIDRSEQAQARVNITQNEFRGALADQADRLASKGDLAHLVDRVGRLEQASSAGVGRSAGFGSAQTLLFQVIPILVAVAAVVIALVRQP